jgi:hypothetical protein
MFGSIDGMVEVISSSEADFAAELTARIDQSSPEAIDDLTVCLEDPPAGAPEPARSDWLDVLEVLRRDVEQIRIEGTEAVPSGLEPGLDEGGGADDRARNSRGPSPNGSSESETVHDVLSASEAMPRKRRRRSKDAPVQDEWGFFDPDRCGFAALLAKLEEITEDEDLPHGPRAQRPA